MSWIDDEEWNRDQAAAELHPGTIVAVLLVSVLSFFAGCQVVAEKPRDTEPARAFVASEFVLPATPGK